MNDLDPRKMKKPKLLYKYARINDDTKNSLKESYLWFSEAKTLNDPFDLRYLLSESLLNKLSDELITHLTKELIYLSEKDGKLRNIERFKADIDKFRDGSVSSNKVFHTLIQQSIPFSICCFTEKDDDILMWSHYAGGHTGVCLIYDLGKTPDLFNILHKVTYSNKYPIAESEDDLDTMSILTKSRHWRYECEWRLVQNEISGKYSINRESLKGVIFGCRTSVEDMKAVEKVCEDAGYKDLEYYNMIENESEYKLDKWGPRSSSKVPG